MTDQLPDYADEPPPRRRWGWYAVQIAIAVGFGALTFEGSGRQFSLGLCIAVGVGLAAVVTVFSSMTADWFRYRPARDKVIWAALTIAVTAALGTLFFLQMRAAGATFTPATVWFPFALAFPLAAFVWLIIGVGGLFRRSPKRGLPLVEQERGGSLTISQRLRAK